MRRLLCWGLAVAALFTAAGACVKVPYTGRLQFNVVPAGVMNMVGKSAYSQIVSDSRVKRSGDDVETLRKVGRRLAAATGEQKGYDWTFKMLDDDTVNAFCLPGGYVAFYDGILPVLGNEASMAFVMGHELGHVVAHHGAERMTQKLALIGGLTALEAWASGSRRLSGEQEQLLIAALGVGLEFGVLLPFSRKHEHEADVIGMMLMAKAGYPPGESVKVWSRMQRRSGDNKLTAFLSTHPSYDSRKEVQREWMSQAKKRYERNKLSYDTTRILWGSGFGDDDAAPARQGGRSGSSTRGSGGGSSGGSSGGSGGRERPN